MAIQIQDRVIVLHTLNDRYTIDLDERTIKMKINGTSGGGSSINATITFDDSSLVQQIIAAVDNLVTVNTDELFSTIESELERLFF